MRYLIIYLLTIPFTALAQSPNAAYRAYIEKYAWMAVEQMHRHDIPASITLAQGLLESGAGRSTLATQANNHFGIKTGGSWSGPYVLRDDDMPNEKFRKYRSAADSYEDHSLFLKQPRYRRLFDLRITDYKGWARGLKACGYATSPTYADNLIRIIELYQLYDYDSGKGHHGKKSAIERHVSQITSDDASNFFSNHPVGTNNGNYYIRIQEGDNLKTISKAVGISQRKLRSYNDLPKYQPLRPGSILYLKSKHRRADRAFKHHPHTLQQGQSLYDVSQMYGIKLKSLYKLNHFAPDYTPRAGEQIRVR